MKSKLFISLLLAVVMLGTLAAPVLADRESDTFAASPIEGTGKAVVQTTHDNYVKVTVSVQGIRFGSTYDVYLQYNGPEYTQYKIGSFLAEKNRERFSAIATRENSYPWPSDSSSDFHVKLYIGTELKMNTSTMTLYFK